MKKLAYFFSLFLILCASHVSNAQMKSDPSGLWGGTILTNAGSGGLEITLARDGAAWKASMKYWLEDKDAAPTVRDLKISGSEISFVADVDRIMMKFAGRFAGDALKGTVEVFQGERQTGAGTFMLMFGWEMALRNPPPPQVGQVADPNFNTKVDQPAYKRNGPKVLFDEAHNNFHTAGGRYKPFADLITHDGYRVVPNRQVFSRETLKGHRVLVISNAIGAARMNDAKASNSAFTDEESDAVRDWVRDGGSLLLIADHAPMGSANQSLGKRFGVDMSKMYTVDEQNHDKESGNPGFIIYTRESGRLADHPVTQGRNASERVNKIMTFTGQSLQGPASAIAFLKLADTAFDRMPREDVTPISAAGRAQGVALEFGKGRVIVMGEAGMLSAQLIGPRRALFGMNRPGIDNRQLALNIMHWLSGLLK